MSPHQAHGAWLKRPGAKPIYLQAMDSRLLPRGGLPKAISQSVTPIAHTSLGGAATPPASSSGDVYSGVLWREGQGRSLWAMR